MVDPKVNKEFGLIRSLILRQRVFVNPFDREQCCSSKKRRCRHGI